MQLQEECKAAPGQTSLGRLLLFLDSDHGSGVEEKARPVWKAEATTTWRSAGRLELEVLSRQALGSYDEPCGLVFLLEL
jgi:hypothetical protein